MKATVAVLSTPTIVVKANKSRTWIILENSSDTTLYIDIPSSGSEAVSTSNGISLTPGEKLTLSGGPANNQITAIHGGTGEKTMRIQGGSD